MKIVVACDSFKGCLSSEEAAAHIKAGILRENAQHEVSAFQIADGGEGTVEAFCAAGKGELITFETKDAYMKPRLCQYALIEDGKTAVMEVANIIGLSLYPRDRRSPMYATSYGVGLVLKHLIESGIKKIIIALGGSCTNDGGMGMLMALGARFYDSAHQRLLGQAQNLEKVRYLDLRRLPDMEGIELIAACDVKNYLLGEQGATYVFGKQKGLYPNQIPRIERGMVNYCYHIRRVTKINMNLYEGGGAAGGIGAVLQALLHAKMRPGIELLIEYSDLPKQVETCDLVITGEGQSDAQTKYGKVPVGILKVARQYEKPCIIISGALGLGYMELYELGFAGIFSIADRAMTFQQALEQANDKLEATAFSIMHLLEHTVLIEPNK